MKALLLAVLLPGVALAEKPASERPAQWARSLKNELVGNLHQVSDQLFRCAQPTAAGLQELEKLGVRTVINLRTFHDDQTLQSGASLRLEHIRMQAWWTDEKDIVRVLALLQDKTRGPFLVHCQHGADRTGLIVALHRMLNEGWSKEDAFAEMSQGGFGYHTIWRNMARYFKKLDDADMARLRQKVAEQVRRNAAAA